MKIIMAPDSFKGALRADKAAAALAEGWHRVRPGDEVLTFPMSDGGEGLTDALMAGRAGRMVEIDAHDARMRPVRARAGVTEAFAVLESAEANGIERLTREELAPLVATTFGVGEMLNALLKSGAREILIGIGGSATVDGGVGMLQALGAKFFRAGGALLPPGAGGGMLEEIVSFDLSALPAALRRTRLRVACDVTNPLCGAAGAAPVFGPQKGADAETVKILDSGLRRWAGLFGDDGTHPGDGAAGGLGFALRRVLGAEMVSGVEVVMEASGFLSALSGSDLVVTGEGCSDEQTVCGKLCAKIAAAAQQAGTPTVLCSGALRGNCEPLERLFAGCFSIASGPGTLEDAIARTAENLRRAGSNLAKLASAFPGV